jgi:predicted alpha-1,2-mannosidase
VTTRRDLLVGAAAATLVPAGAAQAVATAMGATTATDDVCTLVDLFIGTGGHGHTTPAATVPFGMIQLGPDTDVARWDSASGYHHDDTSILGFSHNHLSGTGVGDMQDVLVMPATGPVRLDQGTLAKPEGSYRQRFDHRDESAEPGYYSVRLKDTGIAAELTATARVGLHRYRFPAGTGAAHVLVDLASVQRNDGSDYTGVTDATLRLVAPDLLVGTRRVHKWADGRQIHFAMRLSRPCQRVELFSNDRPLAAGTTAIDGSILKAALHFDDAGTAPLLIKVALSGVDIDGAMKNLDAELPGWDFEAVRTAARRQWATSLGRIKIQNPGKTDARIFYTALYHCMVAPTIFSDVDGRYRGMDTAVHRLDSGEENYSTYSLWDTYRTLHPLLTLMLPERNASLVRGLIRMAEQSPLGPPVWPLQGIETQCMIGWHSAVVIAEAIAKKAPGVDAAAVWPVFRARAFDDTRFGLEAYRQLGYIPADKFDQSVSKTLEYAYDDWAMARIAHAAGAHDDAKALRERSRCYANLFDRTQTFVRPRMADGKWGEPFDPRSLGHDMAHWFDFTESNAWQATFLNQHDVQRYMGLFGGDTAFAAKLDALFAADSTLFPGTPPDVAGLVGQYAHGNEPSHHVAYLYAYAGVPHKTQARVRMLMRTMYRAQPDGLAGNEDCGQMSAWYVMSALGLYPVDPTSGIYVFGSPLFSGATIDVGGSKPLVIEASGNGPDTVYVQEVRWNGKPWSRSWISHDEVARGGHLAFRMGTRPNPAFGAAPPDRPPSFI